MILASVMTWMTLKGLLIGIIAYGRDDPERITNRDNNMWKRGGLIGPTTMALQQ
jgi:hypothetical protein